MLAADDVMVLFRFGNDWFGLTGWGVFIVGMIALALSGIFRN